MQRSQEYIQKFRMLCFPLTVSLLCLSLRVLARWNQAGEPNLDPWKMIVNVLGAIIHTSTKILLRNSKVPYQLCYHISNRGNFREN